MATACPRINAVLEPALFRIVERLARREGVSLSQKVRDMVLEAAELLEDSGLDELVRSRRAAAPKRRWISHERMKRALGLR